MADVMLKQQILVKQSNNKIKSIDFTTDNIRTHSYVYGNTIIVDDVSNVNELDSIEIIIHAGYFWKISCKLLEYLGCIKTKNGKIFITIPRELFTNDKSFIGFPLCDMRCVSFEYKLNPSLYFDKKKSLEYSLLCDAYKYQYQSRFDYQMTEYQEHEFNDENQFRVYANLVCVGFFIAVQKLPSRMEIILNNSTYVDYEKWTYKHIGTKIYDGKNLFRRVAPYSHYVLNRLNIDSYTFNEIMSYINIDKNITYWIPFTPHKKWNDSPDGGINFSKMDQIVFRFPEKCTGTLYFMTLNEFRVAGAICQKHYVA